VLVVDDGSEDETARVVEAFGKAVKYIRKRRGGPASARNLGVLSAGAEWIAFLDADDLWMPQRLERQLALAKVTGADFVFCDATITASPDCAATTRFADYGLRDRFARLAPSGTLSNPFKLLLEAGCFILPSTVLVRRKCLLNDGSFDESLYTNEDIDLWLRLSLRIEFAVLNEALVTRRMHGRNISLDPWTVLTGELKVCERVEERCPNAPGTNWRKIIRKKKAGLYRTQGSLYLGRNETCSARKSWTESFRLSPSVAVAAYWATTLLPGRCATALQNWKAQHSSSRGSGRHGASQLPD
jgi:glycosyltransferase involved in cell wall biosynthesis